MPRKVGSVKEKMVPTPLWKRVIAYLLDGLIVSLIIGVPFSALMKTNKSEGFMETYRFLMSNPSVASKIFLISILTVVLAILYWAVFEYKFEQSIGKLVLKINVRSTKKGKLTFSQCFLRNITKASTLLLALDCLYLLITRSHQRYMEKVSNTEVVEKRWAI